MTEEFPREHIGKTSPYKKAGYAAVFVSVAAVALPFAFGINTFTWVASWIGENWSRLIIIAVLAAWIGKSHFSS